MENNGSDLPSPDRGLSRFRARVLFLIFMVNLIGGLLIYLYFSVIDVSSFGRIRFIRSWETLLMALVPATLAMIVSRVYSGPLFEYLEVVARPGFTPLEEKHGGGRIIHLRRRALRFPIFCAIASLAGWLLLGALIAIRVWTTGRSLGLDESLTYIEMSAGAGDLLSEGLYRSGSTFRRHWMHFVQSLKGMGMSALAGGMVCAVIFFIMESVWQRELPRFFPGGQITFSGS